MSTLVLVRHGQATPFEAETDRLSPLGVRQAEAVAQYWCETGFDAHEVHTGTLERQQRTAAVVAASMAAAGRPWPPSVVDSGFDEYDGDGIFGTLATALAERDAHFRQLVAAAETHRDGPERNRHFQRMVEHVA
ncbi:MAG TPA: histidine phosphatase family protein, partial [Euzebyales bacterium]|nr:histidine phosphatase family protein [Euzebyales bacterium]